MARTTMPRRPRAATRKASDEKAEASPRPWVICTVLGVWLLTIAGVLILANLHPHVSASVLVHVSECSFRTTATHIFESTEQEEVTATGLRRVTIIGKVKLEGEANERRLMNLVSSSYGTCTFTRVQAEAIQLTANTAVTLDRVGKTRDGSVGLMVNQPIQERLTTQAAKQNISPGFSCTRVSLDNSSDLASVNGTLSATGGDIITFTTDAPARIDFTPWQQSTIKDTQIPISGALQFWRSDPGSAELKTVLVDADQKNEVLFDSTGKPLSIGEDEVFEIFPKGEFWIKTLEVNKAIRLGLEGTVVDFRTGPGVSALQSKIPSLLDRLMNAKGLLGLIPAAVAAIIGILERMRLLPKD